MFKNSILRHNKIEETQMPFERKRADLLLSELDNAKLQTISKSGKESFSRVSRAKILLSYSRNESINSIAKKHHVSRPTVEKCVDKALVGGDRSGFIRFNEERKSIYNYSGFKNVGY